MCVGDNDPIALFLAAWEARPHKDTTEILRAYSQAHYEILPKKVETPKHKEESLLYDKGQVIDLDGSPIGYLLLHAVCQGV
jgi:hypothetical protein